MRTWGQINLELTKFAPGVDAQLRVGWIQDAYHRVLSSRNWKGLELTAWLETVAVYETGTIAVTAGSAAVTGTGTVWTTGHSTRKIRITGRSEWYTFTRVSGTTGTLDRVYEGDDEAAGTYRIFQDEYALASGVKFIQSMTNLRLNRPMPILNTPRIGESAGSRLAFGEPQVYTPVSDSPEASPPVLHRAALYPIPEEAAGFPYIYQYNPTDFSGANTTHSPLPWVSDAAIMAYAKASILDHEKDYNGALKEEARADVFVSLMSREENERNGPLKLKMAPRFVSHRAHRWQR